MNFTMSESVVFTMLYRRKVILALLEIMGADIPRTDFQKYLFLLSELQSQKSFEFVPYKFGSFSFSSYVDKRAMTEANLLINSESWKKADGKNYYDSLRDDDKKALLTLKKEFGALHGNELIRVVYLRYPYYAINSEIAAKILSESEQKRIDLARPDASDPALFTIGYEGRSPEGYLNLLIHNAVKLLVDVRRNALSMKYGFSGRTLSSLCKDVGIKYIHIPELGIASEFRKDLVTQADYDTLFNKYENELKDKILFLDQIKDLVKVNRRVAITCFERDPRSCHRHKIAAALPCTEFEIFNL